MYAKVLRKQFEIKEGVITHTPTGAEFTPVNGTPEFSARMERIHRKHAAKR